MSPIHASAMRPDPERISSPYTPDPNRREARRAKLAVYVGVPVFCLFWGAAFALIAPALMLAFALPWIVLGGGVLWALPDNRSARVQGLSGWLFAFMTTLVMWPNYIALTLPGLPWITMNRLTGFPLALCLLYYVASSTLFRERLGAILRSTPVLTVLVVTFLFIEMLSIAFSEDKGESMNQFLNSLLGLYAVFMVSAYVFLKPGRADLMIKLLWIMAIIVGIIAIFESRVRHALWEYSIPDWLQINDPAVLDMLKGSIRNGQYRCMSTFGNPLTFGEFLSLVMPFLTNYVVGSYRPLTRIAAAISVPYIAVICYMTGSRLALVGCFMSLAFTALAWAAPRWLRDRNSFISPLIVMSFPVGFVGALIGSFLIPAIRFRIWGSGRGGTAASNEGRKMEYAMGIPKLLKHLQGFGIGMAGQTINFAPTGVVTVDSYYLNLLMDFGPLGFAAFLGIIFSGIYYCVDCIRRFPICHLDYELFKPLAIALLNFLIIKSVLSEQADHPIVFMMLGMIAALTYRITMAAHQQRQGETAPPGKFHIQRSPASAGLGRHSTARAHSANG